MVELITAYKDKPYLCTYKETVHIMLFAQNKNYINQGNKI